MRLIRGSEKHGRMTDVSLRGKVHRVFTGRSLLSHYRAVLLYTPTQNFVHTGQKKKYSLPCASLRETHKCSTKLYDDFLKQIPQKAA